MLPEHYKKLVHKFKNNCRKDEDEDREEMFEDIKWETVKEMRPCLKNDILRSFTPRSAIDYLLADLNRKPNDESDLLQQRNEKEGGHMLNCPHLLDSMIYYLTRWSDLLCQEEKMNKRDTPEFKATPHN